MNSILITGCNRGLGLGLIKQLVKEANPPKNIIATCRDIEKAQELRQIADQNKNIHILELDVTNTESFKSFSTKVEEIVKDNGLNVLFNNAGYSTKFTRVNYVKAEQMMKTFAINTVGPLMLTKALLPLLQNASMKNSEKPVGCQRAAILNMTSMLGSMELNTDGGLYPYRCSKAGINMVTKSLSIDLKNENILVTCIHPGWVKTDMGGNNAPMDIDASTKCIVNLLKELNESHNGGFYQWDGKKMPW